MFMVVVLQKLLQKQILEKHQSHLAFWPNGFSRSVCSYLAGRSITFHSLGQLDSHVAR